MLTVRALLLLLLAAPLIAAATWIPLLEWLAGLYSIACLLLFWTDWRLAKDITRFEVRRIHDNRLSLGANNPVRIAVRNRAQRETGFTIRDEAPEGFETDQFIQSGSVRPGETWEGVYMVRPLRRGDYRFGDLHIRWEGPFRLVIRQARVPSEAAVKVYPNLMDIRRYDLMLRQNRLQEMGLRHTRMFGEGTEYERLREYLPDDDYRRINWKATARRNRPISVEFQTERSQNVIVLLDTGRMMQSPIQRIAKLDFALNAALLLAYVAAGKGDKVGLMTFSDRVETYVSPRQGRRQFYRLLEQLYRVDPQPVESDFRKAFAYLGVKHRKRALVVVFTELTGGFGVEALVESVTRLSRQSLPLVVTISDPDILEAAEQVPRDSQGAYLRAAAENLIGERKLVLDTLHRRGILTLDVPANRLSLSVINRYLQIKGRTRL